MYYVLVALVLLVCELVYFQVADRCNIIDKPNERSSHTRITLRGGGVIFYLGVLYYFLTNGFAYPWFMLGLTGIAAVSFADDVRSVSQRTRLAVQFAAMVLMFVEWGIGDTDFSHADIIELNKPVVKPVRPCQMAIHLAKYTDADEACSACYASLIRALKRFEETGGLTSLKGRKIAIGQGYKGKHPELGVGICCQGAEKFVRGCPAKADDILRMLEEL